MAVLEVEGWRFVTLLVRTHKHTKVAEDGKHGVRYEGKYVYARLVDPAGKRHQVYLGPAAGRRRRRREVRVEKRSAGELGAGDVARGGEPGWRKPDNPLTWSGDRQDLGPAPSKPKVWRKTYRAR